jgi:hypothetical protein
VDKFVTKLVPCHCERKDAHSRKAEVTSDRKHADDTAADFRRELFGSIVQSKDASKKARRNQVREIVVKELVPGFYTIEIILVSLDTNGHVHREMDKFLEEYELHDPQRFWGRGTIACEGESKQLCVDGTCVTVTSGRCGKRPTAEIIRQISEAETLRWSAQSITPAI